MRLYFELINANVTRFLRIDMDVIASVIRSSLKDFMDLTRKDRQCVKCSVILFFTLSLTSYIDSYYSVIDIIMNRKVKYRTEKHAPEGERKFLTISHRKF